MWRQVVASMLIVNLWACPYLCGGIVSACCDDLACPKNAAQPDRSTPRPPDNPDPCNELGSSCICTGATIDEPGRAISHGLEFQGTIQLDSSILPEVFPLPNPTSPLIMVTRWPAASGPRLRAVFSSFLL